MLNESGGNPFTNLSLYSNKLVKRMFEESQEMQEVGLKLRLQFAATLGTNLLTRDYPAMHLFDGSMDRCLDVCWDESSRLMLQKFRPPPMPAFEQAREALVEAFRPANEAMARIILPPNLHDAVGEVSVKDVRAFVGEEAIPLYLIPRCRTAIRLLHAKDSAARRKVLNSCFTSIVDDCERLLLDSKVKNIQEQVDLALQGISAVRDGHTVPAQALFAVLFDTLVTRLYPNKDHFKQLKKREEDAKIPEELASLPYREMWVWHPVWNAHVVFYANRGDKVPHKFSRHASVHAAMHRQYNKRNCIQALMLVASLVGYANNSD